MQFFGNVMGKKINGLALKKMLFLGFLNFYVTLNQILLKQYMNTNAVNCKDNLLVDCKNLCLEVPTVHVSQLRLFWAMIFILLYYSKIFFQIVIAVFLKQLCAFFPPKIAPLKSILSEYELISPFTNLDKLFVQLFISFSKGQQFSSHSNNTYFQMGDY